MIQPHLEPQFVNSVSPGSELRPELTAQNVTRAYESLEHLPCDLGNLEPFLDAWSDVARWVRQGESHVYWKRHQNLNDDLALEAFTNFYGPITEAARHGEARLRSRFLALDPASLPEAYRHIRRFLEAEERSNVQPGSGLFEQQSELVAKFVNDLHGVLVDFDGQPLSISSLNRLSFNDTDRAVRERAWRAVDAAMLEHFDGFANDFIAVLELRSQIAQESGNASFVEHHWWSRNRSDYAPADCVVLADAVAEHFGPLLERFHERKCDRLGLESVRPWDVRFEPDAGPVGLEAEDSSAGSSVDGSSASMGAGLKVEDCLEAISEVLNGLHPKLAGVYDRIRGVATPAPAMTEMTAMTAIAQKTVLPAVEPVMGGIKLEGLERFDLESRPDKSNANFADYWPEARHPVVMMNFEGSADDFGMLVHEFGHALHFALAGERQRHYWSLTNSLEFMEFTSQFLELLVLERLGAQGLIFDAEGFALAHQNQARVILTQLMHVCRSDRFQQWIYNLSPEGIEAGQVNSQRINSQQINAAYVGLVQPFHGGVNWDGFEESRSRAWLDEGLFAFPLYDIEYVFAWVASLLLLEAVLPLAEGSGDDSSQESGRASSRDTSPDTGRDPIKSGPLGAEVNLEVLDRWVAALEAGNTLSTGELFRAVGLSFPFAAADVARAARVYERQFSAFL
jgi:oligoendopeptidase F